MQEERNDVDESAPYTHTSDREWGLHHFYPQYPDIGSVEPLQIEYVTQSWRSNPGKFGQNKNKS